MASDITSSKRARLLALVGEMYGFGVDFHDRDAIRQQIVKWADELAALVPSVREEETRQPPDLSGKGRLLLNEYGRRCYDAGRESAQKEAARLPPVGRHEEEKT
jgi:hypothetical protein